LGIVLILSFLYFGGTSFSSSVKGAFDRGLQPLQLQGLKPQVMESFVGTEFPTSDRCELNPRPSNEYRTLGQIQRRQLSEF
jgi:hypothetical protein